jgi:Ca2+-binding RTX toxin-like protein
MANFTGTTASETFDGTEFNDTAFGNGGNDILNGNGSDDTLQLGANGTSTASGGAGNDTLNVEGVGTGVKTLLGGDNDDRINISGTAIDYVIDGGSGDDTLGLFGAATVVDFSRSSVTGVEHFVGSNAADTVTLTANQFVLFDSFDGGAGTDTVKLKVDGVVDASAETKPEVLNVEVIQVFGGAGDDTFTVNIEQFTAINAFFLSNGADTLNVLTSGDVDFTALFPTLSGVETVNLIGTSGTIRMNVAQFARFSSISDELNVVLADTGARLKLYTPAQIGALSAAGVDVLDATDGILALTVAQFRELGTVALTATDVVTLADTGANLATLSTAELIAAAAAGVDRIDATNNVLSLTVDQYRALVGEIGLTAKDVITLADTGENLADLTLAEIAALTPNFIDKLDATDGVLTLSLEKIQALDKVALTASDVVTATATGAEFGALTTTDIRLLGTKGVDFFDATDDVVFFTKNQYLALVTIKVVSSDEVVLRDSGGQLIALTPAQFAGLADRGFDRIDSTTDALTLSAAQYGALGTVVLTAGDVVLLRDTGAAIGSLSVVEFQELVAKGIDKIDATDNVLTVNVAKVAGLVPGMLTTSDVVTLLDTGTAIGAMSVADIAGLAARFIDRIDSVNGVLSLTVAQYQALGTVTLTAEDTITLADTGANLAALSGSQLAALAGKGIDRIDATDNALSFTLAKLQALGAVALVAADVVTLADTATVLNALTPAEISALAGKGVDRIDSLNNTLSWSVAQALALGTVTLTAGDLVTVVGTGAEIAALTSAQIATLAARGVDRLDASDDALTLTRAQYLALGAMTVAAGDVVVLADTSGALLGLTPAQFGAMAAAGIDRIDATDNVVILSAAQYLGLGSVALTAGDAVTLRDTGANIAALSAAVFAGLAAKGVDKIDANDNALALTVAQVDGLAAGMLTASDVVTLADAGATISAQADAFFTGLVGKGVDRIDATDDVLSLTVAKYLGLGTVVLTAADMVTLADSGANLAALSASQIAALAGKGVDAIDATNNVLSLTFAKLQALGTVTLAAGDTVTLADTTAALEAMSVSDIAALAGKGVDRIDSLNNTLTLSVAKGDALGDVLLTASDVVTAADTSAELQALSVGDLASLAGKLVDRIDATDNVLALTLAKLQALGTVALTAADVVTLADTSTVLNALTPAEIAALAGKGIDQINATDDALTLSVEQYRALGTVALTQADYVILADTSANLATLTPAENAALTAKGIDEVQSSGSTTVETALATFKLDDGIDNLTFIGEGSFTGTGNEIANTITGGASGDTLSGLGANDTLVGLDGDDLLIGGLGTDTLDGGNGADYISYRDATAGLTVSLADPSANTGEALGDTFISIERIEGSAFNDILTGDATDNALRGGLGADALNGGAGRDTASYFYATAGLTVSLGVPGNNTGEAIGDTYVSMENISGSAFNDLLFGDANDNTLLGNGGADQLDGGAGFDYASYRNATTGVTAFLDETIHNTGEAVGDTYIGIEALTGSNFNDTLVGDANSNWLDGGLGFDILNGGAGFDYASYFSAAIAVRASLLEPWNNTGEAVDAYTSIEGLAGSRFDDILIGDGLDNNLRGGLGADYLDGGNGYDFVEYRNAAGGLTASLANPGLNTGEAAGDTFVSIEGVSGSLFNDTLTGNGGDNWLIGLAGADVLDGGLGNDFAGYSNATAAVTASLANPGTNTGDAAGDTYVSIESLSGTSFNDILIGDSGNNVFRGRLGADQLNGGDGFDVAEYLNSTTGLTVTLDTSLSVTNTGEAVGDTFISIEGLSGSNFSDILVGDAGANTLFGRSGGDIFFGGVGNDTFYGNSATAGFDGSVDRADYSRVTGLSQGISVNWLAGSVVGQAGIIDTDSMFQIEAVFGTAFVDTFDATGFSNVSARAGDFGGYQLIQGGGGNDIVIGNNNTEVHYGDATSSVTVNLSISGGVYGGTVTGGGVGTDQVTNVNRFIGSNFNDTFFGTNNVEIFDGYSGGDDVYHGGGGTDIVEFDGSGRDAIDVNLAAGTITGRAPGSNIGSDTLDSIERIRGSEFADRYDASGFSNLSTNAGSSGNFNRFEGQGGADEVIGNGNTYLDYFNTSAGITVTTTGQGVGTAMATYGSNTATDTFAGIAAINGGNFNDTFNGGSGADLFFGGNGNDFMNGGAGDDTLEGGAGADSLSGGAGFDYVQYRNANAAVSLILASGGFAGDALGDHFISIEGAIGSNFNDTLTGSSVGNILMGGLGADMLNGGAGPHVSYDDADYASYANSSGGLTVSLEDPSLNTGEAFGDTFVNINGLIGSNFNDVLTGRQIGDSNVFIGGFGNDTITGGWSGDVSRYDTAFGGIDVNMATGVVNGGAGQDTLFSIEYIWGSNFADNYNASAYTQSTQGASQLGFNFFEGFGGADTISGSLAANVVSVWYTATSIGHMHATAGITVNMSGAAAGTVTATYGADTSVDSFINVNNISGSAFGDTFNGTDGTQGFFGGAGDDVIHGGEGGDFLMGDLGADVLDGGNGFDVVLYNSAVTVSLENSSINTGEAAGDTYISIENINGSSANDVLIGDSGNNRIDGTSGADVFNGRGGFDTLAGYGQGDTFVFDSALSAGNLATIQHYSQGEDHFNLDNAIFTQLGLEGELDAGAFVNGTAALDTNDRIIFDIGTGNVSYDADGSGVGAAVVFAKMENLSGGPLEHTDFLIV